VGKGGGMADFLTIFYIRNVKYNLLL